MSVDQRCLAPAEFIDQAQGVGFEPIVAGGEWNLARIAPRQPPRAIDVDEGGGANAQETLAQAAFVELCAFAEE